MTNRRDDLLDAAIAVLGESGIHALTHRAVDAAAGLPAGSASNHFRTRDALLGAVVERFAAGFHPSLRAQLAATGARVNAWFTNWIRIAGSADPQRDAPIVMNHWTGLVLHQLAHPDPAFDPAPQLTALVTAVIQPHPAPAPA